VDKDLSSSCVISWNHQEFEVQYPSLADEIKIGGTKHLDDWISVNETGLAWWCNSYHIGLF